MSSSFVLISWFIGSFVLRLHKVLSGSLRDARAMNAYCKVIIRFTFACIRRETDVDIDHSRQRRSGITEKILGHVPWVTS